LSGAWSGTGASPWPRPCPCPCSCSTRPLGIRNGVTWRGAVSEGVRGKPLTLLVVSTKAVPRETRPGSLACWSASPHGGCVKATAISPDSARGVKSGRASGLQHGEGRSCHCSQWGASAGAPSLGGDVEAGGLQRMKPLPDLVPTRRVEGRQALRRAPFRAPTGGKPHLVTRAHTAT
jgi:hypothetical protein